MSKFFKYQQVDSKTGISVALEPSMNGLVHPDLPELKVITFSKDGVWVYAETADTAVENPDNYIFEIDKNQFAFQIKTKIDLITDERLKEMNIISAKYVEKEIESLVQDPSYAYKVNLIEQTVNKLKDKILDQLNSFVFDNSDPIESHNQWDNKFEILKSPYSELKIPFYSVNFNSRMEFFIVEEEFRIKESGTDEEKIGLGIMPPPATPDGEV